MQLKYTLGEGFIRSLYHNNVIRGSLTRNIATHLPQVRDEIACAFNEEIPITSGMLPCFLLIS